MDCPDTSSGAEGGVPARENLFVFLVAGPGVAWETRKSPRHQVALITAHELTVGTLSCRNVCSVVRRNAVLFGDGRRMSDERCVHPYQSTVVGHRDDAFAQPAGSRVILP